MVKYFTLYNRSLDECNCLLIENATPIFFSIGDKRWFLHWFFHIETSFEAIELPLQQ